MSLGSAKQGQIVPEYTTEEVVKWVDGGASFLSSMIDMGILLFMVIGLLIFMMGIAMTMKASRDDAEQSMMGGAASHGTGLWMMIGGGILGSISAIYLWMVGFLGV